tara:strand:+ start:1699 stop:1965 length:267 start_codon:yes stop_codon:yes gene_type:complete
MIDTYRLTWIMFGLTLLTGDLGVVLLWFFIWMPLAMNIKMELEFKSFVQLMKAAQRGDHVNIEGSVVEVSSNPAAPDPLTVGMSMGNP